VVVLDVVEVVVACSMTSMAVVTSAVGSTDVTLIDHRPVAGTWTSP
jgi:hypothetical protein